MTKRNYNIDLARILATLFVIVLHVLGQGGILKANSPDTADFWIMWLLEIGAYCAVNCFALISGYVMVNKSVKIKSIIGLWFQVLFYSLLISGLFFIFAPQTLTTENILNAIFPVMTKQWWYISAYFALFVSVPLLNAAVNNVPQKVLGAVLIAVLLGFGILGRRFNSDDAFALNNGYSAIWLMIMYLFGAYIKKYDIEKKFTALKSLLCFVSVILITLLSKIALHFILGKNSGALVSYTSVTIVLASIFLVLFCLNAKIGKIFEGLIKFFAPATLGVYLIHVHPFVFHRIIKGAFAFFADMPIAAAVCCVFVAVAAIFLVCSLLDLLRIQIFKLIRLNKLASLLGEKANILFDKIHK